MCLALSHLNKCNAIRSCPAFSQALIAAFKLMTSGKASKPLMNSNAPKTEGHFKAFSPRRGARCIEGLHQEYGTHGFAGKPTKYSPEGDSVDIHADRY